MALLLELLLQGSVDETFRRLECGLYTHFGRIDQVRIVRRFQGAVGAVHVALVALDHIGQNLLEHGRPAPETISSNRRFARTSAEAVT